MIELENLLSKITEIQNENERLSKENTELKEQIDNLISKNQNDEELVTIHNTHVNQTDEVISQIEKALLMYKHMSNTNGFDKAMSNLSILNE